MKQQILNIVEYLKSCKICYKALFITIISIFLSLLPLLIVFLCNLIRNENYFTGITFALGMSFIYSLIIPGLIGIIKEKEYKMLHKGIHLIISIIVLVLFVISIILECPLVKNGTYTSACIIVIGLFIFSSCLLFYGTYRDEKKNLGDVFYTDIKEQENMKKYSKNIQQEEHNNE